MTLGDALTSDRSRALDLVRLILAGAVIVSHAWPLALGPGTPEPLEHVTGYSLGGWAIGAFFFLSGLLITASAERKSPMCFWLARARRIVPGLGAALLVTLVLAVASGSTAGIQDAASWFLRALTLVSIEHRLPDAFATNPYAEVVNGPLWSLFYEVLAYIICAVFVWAGGTRRTAAMWVVLAVSTALCLVGNVLPARIETFAPLFTSFALGMAVYVWRDRIHLRTMTCVLPLIAALLLPGPLGLGMVGCAIVLFALCWPSMPLKSDVSFGMYIYGWPIAQTIVAAYPGIDPMTLAILSVLATYPVALCSWHLIERPVLSKRPVMA